jgi:hypothetical protein
MPPMRLLASSDGSRDRLTGFDAKSVARRACRVPALACH